MNHIRVRVVTNPINPPGADSYMHFVCCLIKMLICTPHSLYVFEIGTEKFGYDLYISAEQQGIFRHEKIAALFT